MIDSFHPPYPTYYLAALAILVTRLSIAIRDKMSTSPERTKVLIKEEEKPSYIYKDVPIPQPSTGELLVKVLKVSICGSDTILYQWNEGKTQDNFD